MEILWKESDLRERFGWSTQTLAQLRAQGLPHERVNDEWQYPRAAVLAWLHGVLQRALADAAQYAAPGNPQGVRQLIDEETLCKAWGVSRSTLWQLRKHGGLPYVQLGGSLRYDPVQVSNWLDVNRRRLAQPDQKDDANISNKEFLS